MLYVILYHSIIIGVIEDIPMLKVLESSSEHVFVPLTVGGGIREYTDINGVEYSALDVVTRYFRAGKCGFDMY